MGGESTAYHLPFGLRLQGALDVAALQRALDRVVGRHEALRTTFAVLGGEPVQRVASHERSRFPLVNCDLRQHSDAKAELQRLMAEERLVGFDLESGPLVRGRLIRVMDEEHALLITMHHIVSDGWSIGILVKEISALYGAFVRGEEDPLPELEVQYADYAVWQRRDGRVGLVEEHECWKERLEGMPAVLELPSDRARLGSRTMRGRGEGGVGSGADPEVKGAEPAAKE